MEDIQLGRDQYSDAALDDLSVCALEFGMASSDFGNQLKSDLDAQDNKELVRQIETEKAKMSGKSSRRERRLLKDELLKVVLVNATAIGAMCILQIVTSSKL